MTLSKFMVSKRVCASVLALSLALLSGCSSTEEKQGIQDTNTMLIIEKTAEMAPQSIEGEFILRIKNTATVNRDVMLNTQKDYRDQRSVTVKIPRNFVLAMTQMHGEHPEKFFDNKRIRVRGTAKRQRIVFFDTNGQATDKYYYQTHIIPERPETIEVIPGI
ncbi:hypothetical protein ACFO4O_02620 [Glaciecola siphonariae]|uniref:Lipoprotein n=1 Tax=Glaciecola siphonariae TaxID=521012 RepID=A0ABV9LRE2_9ALTE